MPGSTRGASTLTQQTAKNVFLWQGRSWPRKLLETAYTPMIEALWSKRRIVEVYLNLAEFGPGVFGVAAAAKYHFGTTPDKLSARQAAALASPGPKVAYCRSGNRSEVAGKALLEAGYAEEELDGSWQPYGPVGCSACNNGYKGRVGIYQVMPISEEIQRIILRDGSALEIAEQAKREGVRSLRESGLHKVRQGMTSLEEVLAVTNL